MLAPYCCEIPESKDIPIVTHVSINHTCVRCLKAKEESAKQKMGQRRYGTEMEKYISSLQFFIGHINIF